MRVLALVLAGWFMGILALSAAETAPAAEHHKFTWRDLLPRSMQKNPELDISVYTEMSPAGRKFPAPSSGRPTYCVLMDGGLVEEGDVVAGDKPPTPAGLAEVLRHTLAAGGFIEGTPEHPASIVIRYFWGSYNRIAPLDPDVTVDFDDPGFVKNMRTRATLVGGQAFANDFLRALADGHLEFFRLQDPRYDELVEMASGDLYFIIAMAFAPDAAHKKVALWKTVIATDSNALVMRETLPALVAAGRDSFGRETALALHHPRLHEGHVEIGEPVVKGVVPDPASK
jgi:hypothetical protein